MSFDPTQFVAPPLSNPYEASPYSHMPPAPPRRSRHVLALVLTLLLIGSATGVIGYEIGMMSLPATPPVDSAATATAAYSGGYTDGQSSGYSTGYNAGQSNAAAQATAAYQQGQYDDSIATEAWIKANCHPDAQGNYTIWYDSKDQLWCY